MWKKPIVLLFIILGTYQASGLFDELLSLTKHIWAVWNTGQQIEDSSEYAKTLWTAVIRDSGDEKLKSERQFTTSLLDIEGLFKFSEQEKINFEKCLDSYRKSGAVIQEAHNMLRDADIDKFKANGTMPYREVSKLRYVLRDIYNDVAGDFKSCSIFKMVSIPTKEPSGINQGAGVQQYLIETFHEVIFREIQLLQLYAGSCAAQGWDSFTFSTTFMEGVLDFERRYLKYLDELLIILKKTSPFVRRVDSIGQESFNSNYSISLSWSLADMANNKVVVGVKFVQHNNTLHIQVLEGILGQDGKVDKNSIAWAPLPDNPELRPITWDTKTFKLNNPALPFGYAAVGVQFTVKLNVFAVKVLGKKWDFKHGLLLPGLLQISTESQHEYNELHVSRTRSIPRNLNGTSITYTINSVDNGHYIKLQKVPAETDFRQPTVPYFDALEIITNPPRAISGIGLFHKSYENNPGLISLQLRLPPFERHMAQMIMDYRPINVLEESVTESHGLVLIFDICRRIYTLIDDLKELRYGDSVKMKLKMRDSFSDIAQYLDDITRHQDTSNLIDLMKKSIPKVMSDSLKTLATGPPATRKDIDEMYDWLINAKNLNYTYAQLSLPKIKRILSDCPSFIRSTLDAITSHIDGNILARVYKLTTTHYDGKGLQTMHYALTQIFTTLISYEIKSMMIETFLHALQSTDDELESDWTRPAWNSQRQFLYRLKEYVAEFSGSMKDFPGYIQSLDPTLSERSQGDIHIALRIPTNMTFFHYEKSRGTNDCGEAFKWGTMKYYEERDRCSGILNNCFDVVEVEACGKNSRTAVSWKNKEGNRIRSRDCESEEGKVEVYVTDRYNQQCVCYCNQRSEIYLNLDMRRAHTSENMVITGIQFVLIKDTIYTKIKQGRLMPHGKVDPSTNHWIDPVESETSRVPIWGRVELVDVIFPSDYALTGIQFYGGNNRFFVRVQGNRFNYWTGALSPEGSIRGNNPDDRAHMELHKKYGRGPYGIINFKTPVDRYKRTAWAIFKPSAIGTSNSQIQPRFNGLTVEVNPPSVLGGIGIFHHETVKNDGFISFRLHSLNFQHDLGYFISQREKGTAFLRGY
ncbi:uncharacterized protein LOC135170276 [Diachasmimorpha longicaudata]|uniref:uncharacterized protein LOC135170276 n=1 Tax=Diachasmimorpha longicaudata TaxID=58733 RepID=UPI0030B91C7A